MKGDSGILGKTSTNWPLQQQIAFTKNKLRFSALHMPRQRTF
jgi:hypothetical protein